MHRTVIAINNYLNHHFQSYKNKRTMHLPVRHWMTTSGPFKRETEKRLRHFSLLLQLLDNFTALRRHIQAVLLSNFSKLTCC